MNSLPREATSPRVCIGAVSYLNSKPLIEGLAEALPQADLQLDFPSRLADRLLAGTLDVALVPSIASLLSPRFEVVSDACVATRGPVLSVKLYSRVRPAEIGTLALDAGSRTSATLVRILLAERHGVFPQLEPLPLDQSLESSHADAVLLIGDRAMHRPPGEFAEIIDLGQFWNNWTGLPFVFAMWVARQDVDTDGIDEALAAARDEGLRMAAEIARTEAPRLGLDQQTAFRYLTRNLHYHLTSAEKNGLRLFCSLAARHHLVNPDVELIFRDLVPA